MHLSSPDYEMRGPLPYPHSATSTISISLLVGALLALGLHSIFGEAPPWVPALIITLGLLGFLIYRAIPGRNNSIGSIANPDSFSVLRSFYEQVPAMLGILQLRESEIIHIYDNPEACRFFGVLPGETVGKSALELNISSEHLTLWLNKCRESQLQQEPVRFEFSVGLAPQSRTYRAVVSPAESFGSQDQLCCYMVDEITDLKQTEDLLQQTQQRLELTLHAAQLGLWDWHIPSGHVVYGGCWASMLGYSLDEISPHVSAWEQLVHPDDLPAAQAALQAHLAGKTPGYSCEHRLRKKDGSWIWVLDCGRVLERDVHGTPIRALGIHQDISEDRANREQILMASQRKDEFIATLAHELRNPLAPIRTGLQILKKDPGSAQAIQARSMMERQLTHMVRLIEDLLDVSRITQNQLEIDKNIVPVKEFIETALETSKPFIDQAHTILSTSLPSELLLVEGDSARLSQIVSNLLINAAKYTPAGGAIALDIAREDSSAIIRVTDTGAGIPADMLDRVFEMFCQVNHTLNRTQGGLGIGLALVKQLVEMHGGTVQASSAGINKGSTFTVRLPLMLNKMETIAPELASSSMTNKGASMKNILIVDDNIDGAASLAMYLELLGCHVVVAHDGPQALEILKQEKPQIIFLDIGLPGMSGYEVAKKIREMPLGEKPLLAAITGWGSDEDKHKTAQAGCDIHLTKPIDLKQVEKLLAH